MDLWEEIASLVERGEESEKVEFKVSVDLSDRRGKSEFARDVSAIANTPGGSGWLIIGIADARTMCPGGGSPVVGFECQDHDQFRRQVVETLTSFCNPPPRVEVRFGHEPSTGKAVAGVFVPRSFARPHFIQRAGACAEEADVWVRRGSACAKASRDDQEEMFRSQEKVTVINFSGHPLTENDVSTVVLEMNCRLEEVIDRPWTLDHHQPFVGQATREVNDLGFSPSAWAKRPIAVVPPGLAPAAAILMAELHGRMGHFPTVIRIRPARTGAATTYEVGEVIDLQAVRDQGRTRR